ncbi:MAG: hypothetical protein A4E60_02059 [Syntrophorhabdus sp. PtaB.Bin047]|nr:MAG: hypothetical protein A4E60_02059 [Syntrophorhabdus sp. PtaB.Bin047]
MGLAGKGVRYAGRGLLGLAVVIMTLWGVMAIYYSNLGSETLRGSLSAAFGVATAASFIFLPRRGLTLAFFLAAFAGLAWWWSTIPPSNDRVWQKDVAVLPYAVIRGNEIRIHNIRNFHYRSETDYDVRYYAKTFDLAKLSSVDLIAVYWMGDAIAHIMVSFGFEGKEYIAFSIETRKEEGEDYSTIKGFFKQYELIYIAGDERDLIRLRTDYRRPQEDVYLFRLSARPANARGLFMEYVRQINSMRKTPEWYNTLTTNCTTNVVRHVRALGSRARYTWEILLSGYAPHYAYEMGGLYRGVPFKELKEMSYINRKAHMIGDDPEFSRKIREGLPVPEGRP